MDSRDRWLRAGVVFAGISVIVAVVFGALARLDRNQDVLDDGVSSEPLTGPTANFTPSTRESPPTSVSPPYSGVRPVQRYLASEFEPVDSGSDRACGYPETGPASIKGTVYSQSVWLNMQCSNQSFSAWVEYNVPAGCSQLLGVLGLSDSSPSLARVTFEIFADGIGRIGQELGVRDMFSLHLPVSEVFRLKLQASYVMTEGVDDKFDAVFGDLRFLCD